MTANEIRELQRDVENHMLFEGRKLRPLPLERIARALEFAADAVARAQAHGWGLHGSRDTNAFLGELVGALALALHKELVP